MRKEIKSEELKQIQLGVLDAVVAFCTEHNLRYFLGYGTLLGAVRHKGYIPWDDDIDIMMPRKDYGYLLEHFNVFNANYKVKNHHLDKRYPISFAKVFDKRTVLLENVRRKFDIGVNIDIFPLDGLPDNKEEAVRHLNRILNLYKIYAIKSLTLSKKRGWYKNFLIVLCRIPTFFISYQCINNKIEVLSLLFDYEQSGCIANCAAPYGTNEIMDKHIFSSSEELVFESKKYTVPHGWHEYLTKLYGDYMQFPPESQQVTHHSFKAYWL